MTAWPPVWLREPVTPTFGLAMVLIVAGVVLGLANWEKLISLRARLRT